MNFVDATLDNNLAVQGLAGEKLLCHLPLEPQAVNAMLGHGLPCFESPWRSGQILNLTLSGPRAHFT
jgi:hypothetical protein